MSSSITWFNTVHVSKIQNLHGYNIVQEILNCIVCKGDTEQKQVGCASSCPCDFPPCQAGQQPRIVS